MIDYLDKSIINIKQYEFDELDNIVESKSNDNSEIYETGLDKKEKDVVQGTIVRVTDRDVFVDIGFKSEGIISKSEFHSTVPVIGEKVDVFIISFEDRKGNLILSREKAEFMLKWDKLREQFDNSEIITGKIVRRIKGGMIVDLDPVQGFLPGSQIDTKPLKNFDHLMNTPQKFLCVKLDDIRGNIVVSRRAVLEKSRNESLDKVLSKFKVGGNGVHE